MAYTRGEAPYQDTFDASKNYHSILHRPGCILQNSELNEMQSMIKDHIKQIGDSILNNGDIIEGCQLIIQDNSISNNATVKVATLTAGRVYLDGFVYKIPEQELIIKGVGTEKVGIKVNQEVITEFDDNDLYDPASGFANYKQAGAHRLKETAEIVLDDENASVLYTIVNGEIANTNATTGTTIIDSINTTLARRTFEESGNYRLNGLKLVNKGTYDDDTIYATMESGKAYIRGYEVTKQSNTPIPIRRPTDTRHISQEQKTFNTATNISGIGNAYKLNNYPVTELNEVHAIVQMSWQMTRGSKANGSDLIQINENATVVSIQSISGYTKSSNGSSSSGDYFLDGSYINWGNSSATAKEPAAGASYTAVLWVNVKLTKDVNYELITDATSASSYLKILNNGIVSVSNGISTVSASMVSGQPLNYAYDYNLYRRDLLTMDYTGTVYVTEGQPNDLNNVESPMCYNDELLILGSILVRPESNELGIINNDNTRLTMDDLHRLADRIATLEYNQALSDLDNEAMLGEDTTTLKGVLTDGFVSLSKSNLDYTNSTGTITYNASIDLDTQELTLSSNDTVFELEPMDITTVSPLPSYKAYGSLITADGEETVIAEQPYATGAYTVNSYAVFPSSPVVSVSPSVDNWVEKNTITVQGQDTTVSYRLRRWWYYGNASWTAAEKQLWISLGFEDGGKSTGMRATSGTLTVEQSVISSVKETAIAYMRQKTISITGDMFPAFTNNISCKFDGINVSLTPASSNYKGTSAGTLKCDASGCCKGTLTVPANVLCGTVNVVLSPKDNPNLYGSTTYTSIGTTITTTKTVWTETIKYSAYDPLAQSFQFTRNQYLTSVGLYFCVKPTSADKAISVQIRNMVNGYPSTTCYAEKVLYPSDIVVSEDGTGETKVTFDDPVFCYANTQYCVVIMTEDNITSMYYSELGEDTVDNNTPLIIDPYTEGVLFSSSNAQTWTAHQASNLKFKLYGNIYKDEGYVYFREISNVDFDRIMVAAEVSTPTNTELTMEYSLDSGKSWYPISVYNDIEMSTIVEKIMIRAHFKSDTTVSPVILAKPIYFAGFKNNLNCNYITNNVEMPDGYGTVKQVYQVYVPSGTEVKVYYSTDCGQTWAVGTQDDTATVELDAVGWTQYTVKATLTTRKTNFMARIELKTGSSLMRPKVKKFMNILI